MKARVLALASFSTPYALHAAPSKGMQARLAEHREREMGAGREKAGSLATLASSIDPRGYPPRSDAALQDGFPAEDRRGRGSCSARGSPEVRISYSRCLPLLVQVHGIKPHLFWRLGFVSHWDEAVDLFGFLSFLFIGSQPHRTRRHLRGALRSHPQMSVHRCSQQAHTLWSTRQPEDPHTT